MSKNIPKVRKWRVNYWNDKRLVYSVIVDAPTRLFARWAARDHMIATGRAPINADHVTYGVIRCAH